jgi:hypothetical protein
MMGYHIFSRLVVRFFECHFVINFFRRFQGSPVKPLAKLAIPGLKLTGADTKDGTAAVGKGTVLVKAASSDSSESESEDEAPPVRSHSA